MEDLKRGEEPIESDVVPPCVMKLMMKDEGEFLACEARRFVPRPQQS